MKKIDIGKLVNNNYSRDEVIEWLSSTLGEITFNMAKAVDEEHLGTIGMNVSYLSQCALVAKALNEKVNGKKPGTVI